MLHPSSRSSWEPREGAGIEMQIPASVFEEMFDGVTLVAGMRGQPERSSCGPWGIWQGGSTGKVAALPFPSSDSDSVPAPHVTRQEQQLQGERQEQSFVSCAVPGGEQDAGAWGRCGSRAALPPLCHWDSFPAELGLRHAAAVCSQCHFYLWKVLFAPLAGPGSSPACACVCWVWWELRNGGVVWEKTFIRLKNEFSMNSGSLQHSLRLLMILSRC